MKHAVLLLALAVAVRLFFYLAIETANPEKFQIRDQDGYVHIAENLIQTGEYSREPAPPLVADFSRPPVYPLLLVGLMRIGNDNGGLIVLFQILISAGTAGLTLVLAKELGLGDAAASIAAGLVALDPILILLPHYLLSDTLFVFVWTAGLALFARYLRLRSVGLLIASAVLFGLGALTRPVLEFLPLLLILVILLVPARSPARVRVRDAALFIGIFAVLLVPWMGRNQALGGGFILSDISDTNLYYYRAKAVLADVEQISQDAAYQQLDEQIRAERQSKGLSAGETLHVMRSRAWEILVQHPVQTVQMTARGAALLLFDPGYSLVCADLDPNNLTPECFQGEATMLGGSIFERMLTRFTSMSALQKVTLAWSMLWMALLYLAGAVGALRLAREKLWTVFGLLVGSALYFVALSSGAESLYRLRAPILPLLAVLAGVGIARLINRHGLGAGRQV